MELEGVARRHDDEPTRAGPSHPSGPLLELAHRVGKTQVEAHLQVGDVDAHLHGAGAGQPANVPLSQRLFNPFPGASAPTGRPWRPGTPR